MKNALVEKRGKYIYSKFSDKLDDGVIPEAGDLIKAYLDEDPSLALIIDDSDLRYKDLSATNKMESLDALKLVNMTDQLAIVIAEEDQKLAYFANFAASFAKYKKVKLFSNLDEATEWVTQASVLA